MSPDSWNKCLLSFESQQSWASAWQVLTLLVEEEHLLGLGRNAGLKMRENSLEFLQSVIKGFPNFKPL